MKKILLPLVLALFLTACSPKPAWLAPSAAPLRTPIPTEQLKTPEPASFDAVSYVDALLGGGHQTEGATLTLGRDVVLSSPVYLANYGELVIDLNGHTVSYETTGAEGENLWRDSVFIFDESHVTLRGGAIECASGVTAVTAMEHAALLMEGVSVSLPTGLQEQSCGIYITQGAYVEIDGGSITADCAILADDPAQEGTTVVINDGVFGGEGALSGFCARDTVTAIIGGGQFSGALGGLYVEGGPYVTVYGGTFDKISDKAGSGWTPELGASAAWETGDNGITVRRGAQQ